MNNKIPFITSELYDIEPVLYIYHKSFKEYCVHTFQSIYINGCVFFTDRENNAYISYKINGLQKIHKIYDFNIQQKFIKKIFVTDDHACILTFCGVLYSYNNPFTESLGEAEIRIFSDINIKNMYLTNDLIIIISENDYRIISRFGYSCDKYHDAFKKYSAKHEISLVKNIAVGEYFNMDAPIVIIIQDIYGDAYLYNYSYTYPQISGQHEINHKSSTPHAYSDIVREINIGKVVFLYFTYPDIIFVDFANKLYIAECVDGIHIIRKNDISVIVDGEIISVFIHDRNFYYETHDNVFVINSLSYGVRSSLAYPPSIDDLYSEKIDNFYFHRNEIVQKIPTKSAANI